MLLAESPAAPRLTHSAPQLQRADRGGHVGIVVWRVDFNIGAQWNTTLAGRLSGETLVIGRMRYAIEARR